jgi:type IV fimbrial biogenesis protein FimT
MGKTQAGLTLIELMVTLAVAIVLLAVGVPLFTGVAANNRAVAQANGFLTAFKLARSEAVRRSAPVSVCAAADPLADPVECGGSADWVKGLLVFTDAATAGEVDGDDDRLRVFTSTAAGSEITATAAYVRFLAQGEADAASLTPNAACGTSGTCLELSHSDTIGDQTRCLHAMPSGQIRLDRAPCS